MNNKMDVEAYIRGICKETELDFSKLACGYGKKESSKGRYVFDLRSQNLSDKKYAIKYFSEEGIFLIWKLHIKGRTIYSISKKDLMDYFGKPMKVAEKRIELSNGHMEYVYVVKKNELIEVLKRVL